jgi:hypothetical protein
MMLFWSCRVVNVLYAKEVQEERTVTSPLITIMRQGKLEDYFVFIAIRDWGGLKLTPKK